ncbi:sensor histidine kinase [Oryzobacter telluris]|uniref:sensor histidine kinase n=1 Tax=Oryzobacter telluris TaxID=3149179 RepID=UPI00370D4C92
MAQAPAAAPEQRSTTSSTVPAATARVPDGIIRRLEAVPLRRRLVAIVASLVGAALVLTSLATAYLMRSDLMDRVDAELASVARPVASQAFDDLRNRGNSLPSSYAFQLQSPAGSVYRPPSGVSVEPDLPTLSVDDPRVRSSEPFTVGSEKGGQKWRFVAGRVLGQDATFAVGVPLETVNHTVTRLLVLTALIGTAVLALSVVLARFAVRRAFRPLTRIEDTAAAIAGGDLTQRVPERRADDEVTSLTRSLNTMLARIESSFAVREASEERMRQFVADASHELRTPLATVRGYAELYRQGAVREPDAVAGAMERIEAESGRMSGLVEDLLTLARIDDAPEVAFGDVDLTVLVADAVADARVRAPERRIQLLGLHGPVGPTVVHGSESRLRQVVTNLVANALRHTPPGSPVEVAVGGGDGEVAIEVRDHGPGVPSDVATKVFERFYRADPSRGRTQGGGSGLGLAIVAAIVAQHHGRVGVAPTAGGGATFVVRLPQQAPSH